MKVSCINLAIAFVLLMVSCSQSRSDYQEKSTVTEESDYQSFAGSSENNGAKLEESNKDKKLNNSLSSSAAVVNQKDTMHQFVRTADLKFKVCKVQY